MQKNVGQTDKIIRVVAGLAILGAGCYYESWFGAIGIVPIATAFISWCPAYIPLGISTCSKETNKSE